MLLLRSKSSSREARFSLLICDKFGCTFAISKDVSTNCRSFSIFLASSEPTKFPRAILPTSIVCSASLLQ